MHTKLLTIPFVFLIASCTGKPTAQDSVKTIFDFPKNLSEVSGIVTMDSLIWAIQDSGNDTTIFGLSEEGEIKKKIYLQNSKNKDWEDFTKDDENNLYVGDFGNNANDRKDLAIYKILATDLNNSTVNPKEIIRFYYPEQTSFPPKKTKLLYDCEAFFERDGYFYLITKNRSKGFDGTSLVYKIPNKAGVHSAQLMGSFKTCTPYNSCAVTGAAISPNGKKIVLLSHSKLWLFEDFTSDNFLEGKVRQIDLNHSSQKESISFKDNNTVLIADERSKKTGGKLYEVLLNELKSSH